MAGATFTESNYALRKLKSDFMMTITVAATVITLIPLFLVLGYLLFKGATSLNWAFFTHARPGRREGWWNGQRDYRNLRGGRHRLSHRRPDWSRRRSFPGGTSQPSPRGCRAVLGRRYDGGPVDCRGHLRLRRDRPSDGSFFDARRIIRPCDDYGSPGYAHHGRDDYPGASRAARSFVGARRAAVENFA